MPSLHLRPAVREDAGDCCPFTAPMWSTPPSPSSTPCPPRPSSPNGCGTPGHPPLPGGGGGGTLLGYAYAAPLSPPGSLSVGRETTIYLRQDQRGRGWAAGYMGPWRPCSPPRTSSTATPASPCPRWDETLTLASLRSHPSAWVIPRQGSFISAAISSAGGTHGLDGKNSWGPFPPRPPSCPSPSWGADRRPAGPWATAAVW